MGDKDTYSVLPLQQPHRQTFILLHGRGSNGQSFGSDVLGGLSQGCAAALVATLLWEGGRLGALVGMCGWLPYAARMSEEVEDALASNGEGEDDMTSLRGARMTARGIGARTL